MNKLIRGSLGLIAAVAAASLAPWAVATGGATGPTIRYASPTSALTSGACTQALPCRIDFAIAGASAGDQVIVAPGDYHVSSTISATVPIDLEGQPGQAFPHLIGDPGLAGTVLSLEGGTVSRLYVETAAPDGLALDLDGGTGSQLTLVASGGDHEGGAVQLESSPAGTVLRDSVARVVGTEGEVVEITNGSGSGASATLMHVTAIGAANTTALESKADSVTVRNSIVRGGTYDIYVPSGHASASYSNFRPTLSPNFTDGGHNQLADPVFADAANGDYHEQTSSPTIDAGAADPLSGSVDLDGQPRGSGSAPDIGAYEHQVAGQSNQSSGSAAPVASDPFTAFAGGDHSSLNNLVPSPAPLPRPNPGHTVVAGAVAGSALVQLPGSDRFVPLSGINQLPVGSVIDARSAVVWLLSAADSNGTPQGALMYGSEVKVDQRPSANPATDLTLEGGDFGACTSGANGARRARGTSEATTASRRGRSATHHGIVRRLWALDHHGNFRTHGINSVATVRGTVWRVDDRCDGTYTKVFDGAVVVRDNDTGRDHLVTAHHHFLARS